MTPVAPSFGEALLVWLKVGCLGFGGPAGQIALLHKTVVEKKGWIDEARFAHALSFCMLLPGPSRAGRSLSVCAPSHARCGRSLAMVSAAAVGVIAQLAAWFATHLLFRTGDALAWAR